ARWIRPPGWVLSALRCPTIPVICWLLPSPNLFSGLGPHRVFVEEIAQVIEFRLVQRPIEFQAVCLLAAPFHAAADAAGGADGYGQRRAHRDIVAARRNAAPAGRKLVDCP